MFSQKNLSILIPSIGEESSYKLFDAILQFIVSNFQICERIELILLVSGNCCNCSSINYDYLPPNVRIISRAERLGASTARNHLALASSGNFILFCDADSYIFSRKSFSIDLLNVLTIVSGSPRDCCYIFSDSTAKPLSPFSFRLTEWNFIVSRELFISSNMFPAKIGVGSSSLAQSGEAQFLFNAMFKRNTIFLPVPPLFAHPALGTSSEAAELLFENKLYGYNFGASYATILMVFLCFSSLSLYHLASHCASTLILFFQLPMGFRAKSAMLRGRIHGLISSIFFIVRGKSINYFYTCP